MNDAYPEQRICRERPYTGASCRAVFIDFGDAADISPRFHAVVTFTGVEGDHPYASDDFEQMARCVFNDAMIVSKNQEEAHGQGA